MEAIRAERDRIVNEYAELLASDADREAFQGKLGLARVVFPYVENHNFYVEHWSHSVIWRKMRQLGELFVKEGFWAEANDIFFLKRTEVQDALWDYYASWATPAPAAGPGYWPQEIERRRGDPSRRCRRGSRRPRWACRRRSSPSRSPSCSGASPRTASSAWLGGGEGEDGSLKGFAASPGMAEGPARVIFSADQIGEVQQGEILVAPLTAPSWAPIFGKIGATVTDTGGMMSHAAIVCREYGLPAVTGTGFATSTITTGMLIRVDGSSGTVTILE